MYCQQNRTHGRTGHLPDSLRYSNPLVKAGETIREYLEMFAEAEYPSEDTVQRIVSSVNKGISGFTLENLVMLDGIKIALVGADFKDEKHLIVQIHYNHTLPAEVVLAGFAQFSRGVCGTLLNERV